MNLKNAFFPDRYRWLYYACDRSFSDQFMETAVWRITAPVEQEPSTPSRARVRTCRDRAVCLGAGVPGRDLVFSA